MTRSPLPGTRDVQTPGSGRLYPAGIDKPEAPAKAFTNRGINHLRLRFRLVNQSPANRRFTRRAGSMNCKAARKDALTPGASQLMDAEIIIVSGLPRSGTSLMMQMLASGGLKTVTDNVRTADTDNPRGYYELEKVKKIKDDASWLPETRGKAFKMVSQLLFDLPPNERYRIIFMERDLDEMLVSQEAMLQRRARAAGPREEIKRAFEKHLERLRDWLAEQPNMEVLYVKYSDLIKGPEEQSRRVSEFLSGKAEPKAMAAAVEPALYRNRKPEDGRS